jgi:hypothetical protein
VVIQRVEVLVGDRDQLLTRTALLGFEDLIPQGRDRRAIEFSKTHAFADDRGLKLRDLPCLHLQAAREPDRIAVLLHQDVKTHVPRFRIGDHQLVPARAGTGGPPQRISQLERLRVLGEVRTGAEQILAGIMLEQRREIPVHESDQAVVIAAGRRRGRARGSRGVGLRGARRKREPRGQNQSQSEPLHEHPHRSQPDFMP